MKFFGHNKSTTADRVDNGSGGSSSGQGKAATEEQRQPMQWKWSEPEFDSGFVSRILFLWLEPLFRRAAALHKTGDALQVDDLTPLPAIDKSGSIERTFQAGWDKYQPPKKKNKKNKNATKTNTKQQEQQEDEEKLQKQQQSPSAETVMDDTTNNVTTTTAAAAAASSAAVVDQHLESRLRYALWQVIGRRVVFAGIIKLFNTMLQFSFPLLLNAILQFLERAQAGEIAPTAPGAEKYAGYWLAACLLAAIACKAVTEAYYFHCANRTGWTAKAAVCAAVYGKSLRLAAAAQQGTTLGEMVNLMQVDATKIEMFVIQINVLWDGVLQIAGYVTILGLLLGWPAVIGLVVMMLATPVMRNVMGRLMGRNRSMVKYTDQRVKTTNEALQGIRSVKMYTWEDSFAAEINAARARELDSLKAMSYLRGFARAYMTALPAVSAVVTFLVYAYGTNRPITASVLFSSLVAFDQLKFPLLFYPMTLAAMVQAQVSVSRISKFLGMPEIAAAAAAGTDAGGAAGSGYSRSSTGPGTVTVENASVYWTDPAVPLDSIETSSIFDDDDDDKSGNSKNSSKNSKNHSSNRSLGDSSKHGSRSSLQTSRHSSSSSAAGDVEEGGMTVVKYPKAVVRDLNLTLRAGELCAVIGSVGSGKSSLCAALLNETVLSAGSAVSVSGTVAYAAQTAWILNRTIRDNILFGSAYDETRYRQVVAACQLQHDLDMLEDGDMTEIGEKGINLSGGQKQRISVARAAYSSANIIILDDPLSALDPEVAGKLFRDCILNYMKGKTRLLVTNQLQCLPECDTVVALKRGRVIEQGTYEDLMKDSHKGGEVQRLLHDLETKVKKQQQEKQQENQQEEEKQGGAVAEVADFQDQGAVNAADDDNAALGPKSAQGGQLEEVSTSGQEEAAVESSSAVAITAPKALVTKEEREVGAVKGAVYLQYVRTGGGALFFAGVYAVYLMGAAATLFNTAWASVWTADAAYDRHSQAFYLGLYFVSAVLLGVVTFARAFMLTRFGVAASQSMHERLLRSVLSAPLSFFDTTPTGRILSRFSKDLFSVDQELSEVLDFFLYLSLNVVVTIATIVFVTPWFAVALVPIAAVYYRVMNYFREVSRETKRLESVTRSPVYSLFSETLGGLSTIRAYQESDHFLNSFEELVDVNTQAAYNNKTADRWLSMRLEMIGAVIAGLAAMFATHVVVSDGKRAGGDQFASLAGLSLTYAITITAVLNFVVRTFAQLEAAMNSCERVFYYSDSIAQEAPATADDLESRAAVQHQQKQTPSASDPSALAVAAAGSKAARPPADWPAAGEITLRKLLMRYRDDTPLVLKGLDVHIAGGERIGVVGRTGSGKSSLLLCLMRLVEPDLDTMTVHDYVPPITIDGVDILRVGLRELRSNIGIIPQSPVLFSGTIRSNLDPFHDYTDEQIHAALQQCGMLSAVTSMNGGLSAAVAEYGDNLSQGQRQLLCLGRALLRQCRVLLLDEATSSVDYETDREIQRTLREAFADSTVLTIAHRVNTIMDSNQILVMKDGLACEFGPPQELLKDERSLFSDIVRHSQADDNNHKKSSSSS